MPRISSCGDSIASSRDRFTPNADRISRTAPLASAVNGPNRKTMNLAKGETNSANCSGRASASDFGRISEKITSVTVMTMVA